MTFFVQVFFSRGVFFSQGSVFSKVFFSMGSIFSFLLTGAWVHFFLKRFCFFWIEEVWIFAKKFFKKERVAFSRRLVCFLSKGFFLKGDRYSVFWRDAFFSFFQMVLFLLFLQNTRTFFFFFFFKMVEFFQKIRFLQSFFEKETFFF